MVFSYHHQPSSSDHATSWVNLSVVSALARVVAIWLGKANATKTLVLNPVLRKKLEKIRLVCLFGSNVVASLWLAFLVDPLGENTKLDKLPHHAKVGKSVHIKSFSGPYFSAFGLITERYGVSLCIQPECGKIPSRKIHNTDTIHAMKLLHFHQFFVYEEVLYTGRFTT